MRRTLVHYIQRVSLSFTKLGLVGVEGETLVQHLLMIRLSVYVDYDKDNKALLYGYHCLSG